MVLMVWLERSQLMLKVPGSKDNFFTRFVLTLPVRPAVNGFLPLFRAGEGGEEEDWRLTAVAPELFPATSPRRPLWAAGTTFTIASQ